MIFKQNMEITILNSIIISKEKHPHLYEMALVNKDGLEQQLISLDKALGGKSDLEMTAILLESDLAHG